MESTQLLVYLFLGRTRDKWFKCNERLHSFGSLHDGSYLGIGKDATNEVVGVDLFLSEKQRVPGWSGFNAVFSHVFLF